MLDRRPATQLAFWATDHDIRTLCHGTLAGGFLTGKWLGQPDPGFAFENRSRVKSRPIIDEFGPWARFQDLLGALKAVGDRHGVSLPSVATRWVLDQPQVAAASVGARVARHLPVTPEVFSVALDTACHARIQAGLVAILYPTEGSVVVRTWLSLGGSQEMVMANALKSDNFRKAVGMKYLSHAVAMDNAPPRVGSAGAFTGLHTEHFEVAPNGPGLPNSHDAAMIAMLAMEAAGPAATRRAPPPRRLSSPTLPPAAAARSRP